MMKKLKHPSVPLLGSLVAALVTLAAFGSSSFGSATRARAKPGSVSTAAATSQQEVAAARAFINARLSAGSLKSFSAGSSYKPPTGERIGIVSADQGTPNYAQITRSIQQAATLLGWKSTVVDGKGSPAGWNAGIDQLVQQHVKGIFLAAIPDDAVPQALDVAHSAHIPTIAIGAATRLSPPVAHPSLVSIDLSYRQLGEAEADYIIAKSDGKASVALITDQLNPGISKLIGYAVSTLKACSGCSIKSVVQVGNPTNWVTTGATQTQALLSQYPKGKLDYIVPPIDIMTPGVAEALKAAGRSEIKVVTAGCDPTSTVGLGEIRSGGPEVFCSTSSNPWLAYAAVDQMGRYFAHLPTHDTVVPTPYWNKSNLPPKSTGTAGFVV